MTRIGTAATTGQASSAPLSTTKVYGSWWPATGDYFVIAQLEMLAWSRIFGGALRFSKLVVRCFTETKSAATGGSKKSDEAFSRDSSRMNTLVQGPAGNGRFTANAEA